MTYLIATTLAATLGWTVRGWVEHEHDIERRARNEQMWRSIERARMMHPSSEGTWRDE